MAHNKLMTKKEYDEFNKLYREILDIVNYSLAGVSNIKLTESDKAEVVKSVTRNLSYRNNRELRELRELFKQFDEGCFYCNIENFTEIDHILPFAKYPEYGCSIWNLVPVCHFCNVKKGASLPGNFMIEKFNIRKI